MDTKSCRVRKTYFIRMLTVRHVVYECLPGAYAGGVQKVVFELASAQVRAGADVQVWTPNALRAGSTEKHDGLAIRYFVPDSAFGLAKSRALEGAISTLSPGAILHAHSTYHPLNLQVGRAARLFGHRAFYHPHGALDPVLLRGWGPKALKKKLYIKAFERPNLNAARGVFALTPLEKEQLQSLGVVSPIHVVPNGIRSVVAASAAAGLAFRQRHGIPASAPLMLFIGRIVPKKRLEDIIGVLTKLEDSHPELHLVVAGSPAQVPAYHNLLLRKIDSEQLRARVHWVGFLDEKSKPEAYAASQLFIHASESEGMAMAILEAMSAGVPVVATTGCYMGDAAQASALRECAPGVDSLAGAVREVLNSPRGLGESGRAYVTRVHDWDAIARRSLDIYRS